jgi:hypothetical protein
MPRPAAASAMAMPADAATFSDPTRPACGM